MRAAAVIPALEAAATIGPVVAGTRAVLDAVLVVDDGSRDSTAAAACAAGAEVIRLERNRGKGAALRTGMEELFRRGFDAVVTLDADGQHLPEEIPALLEAARGADLVVGCRRRLFDRMSALRRASNLVSSWWIGRMSGIPIRDAQCGFRVYSQRLFRAVGLPEPRYEAENAVIVRAARGGFRVASVPIRLGYVDGRSTSHFRAFRDSCRIARAVLGARYGPLAPPAVVRTTPRA